MHNQSTSIQSNQLRSVGSKALGSGVAIVVDIGKTLSKVSLWSRDGQCLERLTRANAIGPASPYVPLDVGGIGDWLVDTLASLSGHPVEAIIPVAHGAAVAALSAGALTFPPLDYEWEIPAPALATYRSQRDAFAATGSPALAAGLNLGAQLHYLETMGLLEGVTLLPWPQYWAWFLSGATVSEVTSLGCHSDVWNPSKRTFSPLARRRGWDAQFAPLAHAGDVVGTLRPELADRTGLSPEVRVHAGLHDSNAALLAARAFPEIAGREATVLSTGTWFVAMRTPASAEPVALAGLPEECDCLVNVDVDGAAVPSARYMGGREIELLGTRIDLPGTEGLADVLLSEAMVLPSQVRGSGPFPGSFGRLVNWPADEDERRAAIALYAALMTDVSLDLIGACQNLLIEGRFAQGEIFTRALAALRPDCAVWTATGETDASYGALRLVLPNLAAPGSLRRVEPLEADLATYRANWLEDTEVFL